MRQRVCRGSGFVGRWLIVLVVAVVAMSRAATQAQAQPASDAEARGLFLAGEAAFQDGRFDDALRYFQQSYDRSRRPQLLYNIGIAADRMREDERALAAFRQYLAEMATAPQRQEVEARVRALEAVIARRQAQAPTTTPSTSNMEEPATTAPSLDEEPVVADRSQAEREAEAARDRPTSEGPGSTPWIVVGAGGALVVGGAIFWILGSSAANNVEDAERGTAWSSVEGDYDDAGTFQTLGAVGVGLGVAAAAGGVVWALSASGEGGPEASVAVVPGGLTLRGRF